jgi:NodT family efflux transporter outer membrane factor (OMF) lipoprotein
MLRVNKPFLLAALFLAGCAHDPMAKPKGPATPAAFSQGGAAADTKWADAFGDPALLELIAQARQNSPDLVIARARQREAVALLLAANAGDQPAVSVGAGLESSRISLETGRVPLGVGIPRRTDVGAVGVKASWELDVWGREAAKTKAAEADSRAAQFTTEQADLALSAEVARLWFAVRGAREQLAFLEAEFATRLREMEIVEKTVDAGLLDSDPLSSARLAAAQAKVDEGLGRRRLAGAENALRALIGSTPGDKLPEAKGSVAMTAFGAGVPSELLLRRPDLAAAAARLDAAVSREGAAIAGFYPSVTLNGQAGWQADPASRVGRGSSSFWSLTPSIDLPVFDAGLRKANLEVARARIDGSGAEWTKAVLGAFREVEDALADLRELALQEELTARVLVAVRVRLTNAEARRQAGIANENDILIARRDEAMAARTLSLVVWERRQVAVRLAATTGGGWSAK